MSDNYPYNLPVMDVFRNNYELFRLETHQYSHKGLFTDGNNLFAVILEVKNNEELLDSLKKQYDDVHTIGFPIATIVGEVLEHYKPITLRSALEKSHLHGEAMNMDESINQLNLHIPQKYHPFHMDFKFATNQFILEFKKNITEKDKEEIQLICESLGYQGFEYIFKHNPSIANYSGIIELKPNKFNNRQLLASGLIQKQFSRTLLERYEEDEDFWLQNRYAVFSGKNSMQRDSTLPLSFEKNKTRCFVDISVFAHQNIRVYLTLYEQVIIALPLYDNSEHFYQTLKIRPFELRELIARGRLLFVVPQNLVRYSQSLLLEIISVNPSAIIFSRRLAAATIQGIQKKTGIIGTTFSSDEQYDFLHHCSRSKNTGLQRLARVLSEQWQYGEYIVNKEGAISVHQLGLSNMAIMEFKDKGKDFTPELAVASSSYEFAQGLGAHHFPFDSDGYSEVNACQIISGLYNGVIKNSQQIRESELNMLLRDVLAINNDMSVLELDDALSGSLIRTLPNIVGKFANLSEDQRLEKMYLLKKELKQIENKKSKMASLDIIGSGAPAVIGAAMELYKTPGAGYVTLGGWILKTLLAYGSDSKLIHNPIFIKLSSLNHRVSQDALIIKRVRDSISSIS